MSEGRCDNDLKAWFDARDWPGKAWIVVVVFLLVSCFMRRHRAIVEGADVFIATTSVVLLLRERACIPMPCG